VPVDTWISVADRGIEDITDGSWMQVQMLAEGRFFSMMI
jgi:hypothetical protein